MCGSISHQAHFMFLGLWPLQIDINHCTFSAAVPVSGVRRRVARRLRHTVLKAKDESRKRDVSRLHRKIVNMEGGRAG
jgi:hypothetical protein